MDEICSPPGVKWLIVLVFLRPSKIYQNNICIKSIQPISTNECMRSWQLRDRLVDRSYLLIIEKSASAKDQPKVGLIFYWKGSNKTTLLE